MYINLDISLHKDETMRTFKLTEDEDILMGLIQRASNNCRFSNILRLVEAEFFTEDELHTVLRSLVNKGVIAIYGRSWHKPVDVLKINNRERRFFLAHGEPLSTLHYRDRKNKLIPQGFTNEDIVRFDQTIGTTEHFVHLYERIEVIDS